MLYIKLTKNPIILLKIPKPKKLSAISNIINNQGPCLVKNIFTLLYLAGKISNKNFEPSNGGIGIKLNTIKTVLIMIKYDKNTAK